VVPWTAVAANRRNDVGHDQQLNQRLNDLRRQLAERGSPVAPDEVWRAGMDAWW